ncbi:transcriptional regulator [Streptomyces sp. BG9H]|uniref:Transcriptional regulator n=1 Tax=Streptomyces anatolicus TaxID=2675858 RepID=A0ABS6YJN0_9ACTN|nr:helix-turn-helix domain-containing protein [Streptomyces anatolicus]MBW5421622.1 transcriptional regulator [Streptomyces anatolicus]
MTAPLSADMFDPHCGHRMPIRVGDKWSGLILRCLEDGPRRFTELKVPLKGVAPKVLTETLRAMERDGWLTRTAYDENPPRVEYALTELGRSLLAPMDVACAWAREHLDQLPRLSGPARPAPDH